MGMFAKIAFGENAPLAAGGRKRKVAAGFDRKNRIGADRQGNKTTRNDNLLENIRRRLLPNGVVKRRLFLYTEQKTSPPRLNEKLRKKEKGYASLW